jgi:methylenetetrahydrofolate reductase (NADPH)
MTVQYKMNFNEENPLKQKMLSAQFMFLIEYELQAKSENLSRVFEDINGICTYCAETPEIAAMALTDKLSGPDSLDPIDLAAKVAARSGSSPLIHVSGKGHSKESIQERLATLSSEGVNNLLLLTGDLDSRFSEYCDSVEMIRQAKAMNKNFFIGAAVNPYKYVVNDSYAQYFKMIKKVKAGADFIITQTGWDMKKLQELVLFAKMREVNVPLIARLSLISEKDGDRFSELSINPGVTVSREFASLIQREKASGNQFMATQLKRLCLQIAGCSFLGFSGVHISGLRTAFEVKTVMETARVMMGEFRNFREWSEEWKAFHHGIEMVTSPYTFYMFKNLMNFKTQCELDENFKLSEAAFEQLSVSDCIKQSCASLVKVENRTGLVGKILRKLIVGDSSEPLKDLKKTQYISLSPCPKKLLDGPCAGTGLTGLCENGKTECVHSNRVSAAAHRNELDRLEDPND